MTSTPNIHIEGMGWFGSVLAQRLAHAHVPFTWHDTDTPHTAWQASTGIAYPAGDARSMDNLHSWATWMRDYPAIAEHTRAVHYVFAHKKPPHEGNYPVKDLGWARIAGLRAVVVDVPALVPATRERFAEHRRDSAPTGVPLIVAHGFGARLDHYVWGWTAPVRLDIGTLAADADSTPGDQLFAFYGRVHRFQMAYAYPIIGRPGWWRAGSALVVQKTPRRGRPAAHVDRWRTGFQQLFPKVRVLDIEPALEGWRPAPADDDSGQLTITDTTVTFPPLWHSGVRWAPTLVDEALNWARQQTLAAR